ncbi:MAG TPA: hypothetical protein VFZ25_14510 [Chloroflexota bacterium]|nr:hypothetical protein [Chloroflexota bacterium]
MSPVMNHMAKSRAKVVVAAIGSAAAMIAVYLTLSLTPVPSAGAAEFSCQLGPEASCEQPVWEAGPYGDFYIRTVERAGCNRVIGYYGDVQSAWHCYGKEALSGFFRANPTCGPNREALKNNNGTYAAGFGGMDFPGNECV